MTVGERQASAQERPANGTEQGPAGPPGNAPAADQLPALLRSPDEVSAGSAGQRQAALHALQQSAGNAAVNRLMRELGPGRPLDPAVRGRMGAALGADLGAVRVHHDAASGRLAREAGASAVTIGADIAFAPDQYAPGTPVGDALLAHELAHVVQQQGGAGTVARVADDHALEADADRSTVSVLQVLHGGARSPRGLRPALRSGLRLARCSTSAERLAKLRQQIGDANSLDAAGAASALNTYESLSESDRRKAVEASYKGDLKVILQKIPAADQIHRFNDTLAEIGRFTEEAETRASAAMTDDQIAAAQMAFMKKKAEDAAAAEKLKNKPNDAPPPPPPTEKEVQEQVKKEVEKTSIVQKNVFQWDAMTKAEHDAWTDRGNKAVKAVVDYCAKHHPELQITAANFKLAFKEIEQRGAYVVAAGSPAQVGYRFVEAVEANPAYVIDVVVHEVYGHPGYGTYGSEYHLALYDKAMAGMPGYKRPSGKARDTEIDAYAYQETETYAVMRGYPYRTAPTPADAAKVVDLDTKGLVCWHIGLMNQQWAPALIVPILRGLRMRLVVDPRISGPAMNIFDTCLSEQLGAGTAGAVTKS
ncbi:MAG: eCIS core domain-containing protein [Solirubrobacteraceae bacterium]